MEMKFFVADNFGGLRGSCLQNWGNPSIGLPSSYIQQQQVIMTGEVNWCCYILETKAVPYPHWLPEHLFKEETDTLISKTKAIKLANQRTHPGDPHGGNPQEEEKPNDYLIREIAGLDPVDNLWKMRNEEAL